MKPPKLLPWIARKAGIHEELALKLWRRAAGEAEKRVGSADGPEYYATALERFLNLVEDEASARNTASDHPFSWVWRYQKRMAEHGLVSSQATYRWWNDLCCNLSGRSKRAGYPGFF